MNKSEHINDQVKLSQEIYDNKFIENLKVNMTQKESLAFDLGRIVGEIIAKTQEKEQLLKMAEIFK